MNGSHFRLNNVKYVRQNKITIFLLFISTSIACLLIHLLKIEDFEKKKYVQFALKRAILLAFQNSQEAN